MNLDYVLEGHGADFEKDHWWVRSRFGLIDYVVDQIQTTPVWRVLEVGCGTGINLDHLEGRYGDRLAQLLGVDPGATPMRRGRKEVRCGMPSEDSFDLILAMDVLEHVDHPLELLTHLHTLLKPSGRLLVTVPAFTWLWTIYDQLAHHRKRRGRQELISELQSAHFVVNQCFFLFGTLFPAFVIQRLALKWRTTSDGRLFKPIAPWLNRFLYALTSWEMRTWMTRNRWFGSSIVAIAQGAGPP